jgi:RNA polymerase sigma-70 factor (ECF subfamily)
VRAQVRHPLALGPSHAPDVADATLEKAQSSGEGRVRAAVERHVDLVWRVLRRSGLGAADAEDAAQEVFWVLARRLERVPEKAERSFLVSTALRVASDHKRLKWHRSVTNALDLDSSPSEDLEPDRALELRRARELLDEALRGLEEADRQVFVLAELEQMTRAEVAAALDIPEGTVASRLGRAREALEAALRRVRARVR